MRAGDLAKMVYPTSMLQYCLIWPLQKSPVRELKGFLRVTKPPAAVSSLQDFEMMALKVRSPSWDICDR